MQAMKLIRYTCGVAAAVLPSVARAQDEAPEIESSVPWLPLLFTVLATAAICAVAFKSSRRTHLD